MPTPGADTSIPPVPYAGQTMKQDFELKKGRTYPVVADPEVGHQRALTCLRLRILRSLMCKTEIA
eukprot:342487-Rhodomonas_salina.1